MHGGLFALAVIYITNMMASSNGTFTKPPFHWTCEWFVFTIHETHINQIISGDIPGTKKSLSVFDGFIS